MEKLRGGRQLLASLPLESEVLTQLISSNLIPNGKSKRLSLDLPIKQELPKSESVHAIKVLRLKAGESIRVLDQTNQLIAGGTFVPGQSKSDSCSILISYLELYPSPLNSLIIGLPEQKTAEELTSNLTAIGCKDICFFLAEKSQLKKVDQEKLALRLNKKRDAALKQSFSTYSPNIQVANSIEEALSSFKIESKQKVTFASANDHPYLEENRIPLETITKSNLDRSKTSLLIFGTEGGFTEKELGILKNNKSSFMSLGNNVLRLELAAALGLAYFNG